MLDYWMECSAVDSKWLIALFRSVWLTSIWKMGQPQCGRFVGSFEMPEMGEITNQHFFNAILRILMEY